MHVCVSVTHPSTTPEFKVRIARVPAFESAFLIECVAMSLNQPCAPKEKKTSISSNLLNMRFMRRREEAELREKVNQIFLLPLPDTRLT